MPKTRLISPGSIPNHKLLKNLQLQDNFLSNDGGDEGIKITNAGNVGVNTTAARPASKFEVFNTNVEYQAGTAYQSETAFYGTGTTFTVAMRGSRVVFDDGTDAGIITLFVSTTILIVSVSQTVGGIGDLRSYKIYYPSVQIDTGASSTTLKIGNISLSKDEIDISTSGNFTVDAVEDIILSADGGNVYVNDGTNTIFDFDVDNQQLLIQDSADSSDRFQISVGSNGETNITTNDSTTNAAAELNFVADGDLSFRGTDIKYNITARTASGTGDYTVLYQETLNLSSGAGGSDVHNGLFYNQVQTNIAGWDEVWLLQLQGGGDSVQVDANALLSITTTGTAKSVTDAITITNDVNAADMDGTGSAIKFNQWYYDGSSPATEDSGSIKVVTENDWTTTASTRDSYMSFVTSTDGSLAEQLKLNVSGVTISTISEVGSDTDKFLMSDSGVVKYVTGANLLSYAGGQAALTFGISDTNVTKCGAGIVDNDFIRVDGTTFEGRSASQVLSDIGAQATVTAGTNCTFSGATLNVDDAFIKNDANDTMAGKLVVDVDYTGTTSENSRGFWVDYDATGDTGSSQNIANTGIYSTVNSNGQTNAGTIINYGLYSLVTGGTSGTQTSIGGYFKATGADSNYALVTDGGNVGIGVTDPSNALEVFSTHVDGQLKLSYDANNYAVFKSPSDGGLEIESTGTDADILLKAGQAGAEGDIILQAMEGDVFMYITNNYTNALHIDVDSSPMIKMRRTLNDYASLEWGDNGTLTIRTVDNGADAEGHLTMIIDGHVLFNGCGAGFVRKEATFSAVAVTSSGGTDDTDIDFREGNKYRLEMTADIANMNLIFPAVSGNFVLVCTTNGDHDVTNWKVFESDASAATTTDVMWAGGSVPAFTNNGVDIVSFYWDSTEQQCYGVASLAFATP